jgi:anti-anti-sigma regulatory factor
MLSVQTDKIGDMAIIECEGRIVRSDDAWKLHNKVTTHRDARIVVLDLSEVADVEGSGLGMLVFLQRWAHDHDVQLKLFNPSHTVRVRLEQASTIPEFEVAPLGEMMTLLSQADSRYALHKHSEFQQAA